MINILIPITKDNPKYHKLLANIYGEDVRAFVGVTKELKETYMTYQNECRDIFVFEDGSDAEAIINSLHGYVEEGGIVIIRKPIKIDELNEFLSQEQEIVICKKKRTGLKALFFSLWQKILRLFLGVNLYSGSTSVVYFSENIAPVLRQTNNISYASRVDRWRGVEKATVETGCEDVKYKADKKSMLTNIIFIFDLLFIACAVTFLVSLFTKVTIIIGLLLFFLDALSLIITLILLVMTIFNAMVGKRDVGYAMEEGTEIDLEFKGDENE